MKPQGSNSNKPGSKYSPGPVLYNLVLFKTGATDPPSECPEEDFCNAPCQHQSVHLNSTRS